MSEDITFDQLGLTPEQYRQTLAEMDQYLFELTVRLDELGIVPSKNIVEGSAVVLDDPLLPLLADKVNEKTKGD